MHDECRKERHGDADLQHARPDVGVARAETLETVDHQREPRRQEQKADEIEGAGVRLVRVAGEDVPREERRQDADGEVHEEDPPPPRVLKNEARQRWPEDRADHHRHDADAEHPRDVPTRDARGHQLRHRGKEAAGGSLKDAKDDEPSRRAGKGAQERRHGERREAVEIDALRADAIDEPAAQGEHEREREQVCACDPRDRRQGGVKIASKRRERHVDDRGVEVRHQWPERHYPGHLPHERVDTIVVRA